MGILGTALNNSYQPSPQGLLGRMTGSSQPGFASLLGGQQPPMAMNAMAAQPQTTSNNPGKIPDSVFEGILSKIFGGSVKAKPETNMPDPTRYSAPPKTTRTQISSVLPQIDESRINRRLFPNGLINPNTTLETVQMDPQKFIPYKLPEKPEKKNKSLASLVGRNGPSGNPGDRNSVSGHNRTAGRAGPNAYGGPSMGAISGASRSTAGKVSGSSTSGQGQHGKGRGGGGGGSGGSSGGGGGGGHGPSGNRGGGKH